MMFCADGDDMWEQQATTLYPLNKLQNKDSKNKGQTDVMLPLSFVLSVKDIQLY